MDISKTGFWPWFLQRVTAIYLVFGLIVHLILGHMGEHLTLHGVNARLQAGAWVLFDFLLLLCVVYHAFNGLWMVSLDYRPAGRTRMVLSYLLAFGGIVFFAYGVLALSVLAKSGGMGAH
jgi:succinate dehydrogenase / fumarate reductase membrane anchor subunit